MDKLYRMIEKLIRESGCPLEINGEDFYEAIADEAEHRENGTYMFGFKLDDEQDLSYTGRITILDREFDLHYVDIHLGDKDYHVNFDV